MPIVKKTETLALSFKIERKLHDKLDELRALAKKNGVDYDPTGALTKALQRDMDSAHADLKQMTEQEKKKPTNHVDS